MKCASCITEKMQGRPLKAEELREAIRTSRTGRTTYNGWSLCEDHLLDIYQEQTRQALVQKQQAMERVRRLKDGQGSTGREEE